MQFNDPRSLSHIQFSDLIERYIIEIATMKKFGDAKQHALDKFKVNFGELPMSELTAEKITNYFIQRS